MDWKEKEEFQILPSEVIQHILEGKEYGKEGWIEMEAVFPREYRSYLLRVLNSNRHHSLFSYRYLRKKFLTEVDLCRILRRQLYCLTKDGTPCFEKVKFRKIGKSWFLYLKYRA